MSRSDPPDRRDKQPWDKDDRADRTWFQRRFRRGTREALRQQDGEGAERRWRRTSGWPTW